MVRLSRRLAGQRLAGGQGVLRLSRPSAVQPPRDLPRRSVARMRRAMCSNTRVPHSSPGGSRSSSVAAPRAGRDPPWAGRLNEGQSPVGTNRPHSAQSLRQAVAAAARSLGSRAPYLRHLLHTGAAKRHRGGGRRGERSRFACHRLLRCLSVVLLREGPLWLASRERLKFRRLEMCPEGAVTGWMRHAMCSNERLPVSSPRAELLPGQLTCCAQGGERHSLGQTTSWRRSHQSPTL